MRHLPRFSILFCVGALCAGAAGASEPESARSDVAWQQPGSAPDIEAAPHAAIRIELLRTTAPLLASGFDRQSPLRPLPLTEPARTDASEDVHAAARRIPEDPLAAIPMLHRLAEAGLGTRPFSSQWYTSTHTESFPLVRLERLGLFGTQQKYRTLRGSISVGFEAGAAVRVRDHLNLMAGYRMLGYGLGEQGTLEGGDLDATLNAPFLGFAFNY